MHSVSEYLTNLSLSTIVSPANIKYGKAIFKRGGVSIIHKSESEIEIWAGGLPGNSSEGGGSKRRVRFWVEKGKLLWRCAGNPKDHEIFCKHCVAAALSVAGSPK